MAQQSIKIGQLCEHKETKKVFEVNDFIFMDIVELKDEFGKIKMIPYCVYLADYAKSDTKKLMNKHIVTD